MTWHVICLVTIFLLAVEPIEYASPPVTDRGPSSAPFTITVPASHHGDNYLFLGVRWSAVLWAYGACHLGRLRPGRVTLCRWKLTWRWARSLSRKKRPTKKRRSVLSNSRPSPAPVSGKTVAQRVTDPEPTSESPVAIDENILAPLRMVLRPGVILTKRGVQLRPMIARLGEDVEEYRALWNDKEQFKATIEHLLHRSCPLCDGESGFHCVGSDERSVIPPGSKDREWFRIQKVECWACEAVTRILPTFCIPFKSHHAQTIQNTLENC